MIVLVTLLLFVVAAIAALAGYVMGVREGRRGRVPMVPEPVGVPALPEPTPPALADDATEMERIGVEKARIIRSRDSEAAALRARIEDRPAPPAQSASSIGDDPQLSVKLAEALKESARYRKLVIDIENNAPPPILSGAGEPDDLKLIVGIGPVLERMLHNLGVTTFRQIARWSERDSAEFDSKLPEFPGRIVRDQWVTQARELHLAKFGELPSDRPPRA